MCRVLCEPRGAIYFSDNHCNEKAVRCWQFALVVVEGGGEARTVIFCQLCYNERRVQQGEQKLNLWQWRAVAEKKAHRGRIWRIMGKEQLTQWQQESPFREILEQARRNEDVGCSLEVMRKGNIATRDSGWEDFKEECRAKVKSSG